MKTLKISNGDLVCSESGAIQYVDGVNKSSQDVARSLLVQFDSFFNEGNELINISGTKIQNLDELSVRGYLYDALNRLILQEEGNSTSNRIVAINAVNTKVIGLSTVVFYVDVLFASGVSKSIIQGIDLKATELYQVDPTRGVIAI
jgi:hypothetical protein